MDGTSPVYILAPIVIPTCLFTGIALPYIADSYASRRPRPASPSPGRGDSVLKDWQARSDDDDAAQLRERGMDRTG